MDKDTAKLDDLIDLVKRTRADKNLFVTVDELEWCLSQVAALTATLDVYIENNNKLNAQNEEYDEAFEEAALALLWFKSHIPMTGQNLVKINRAWDKAESERQRIREL